MKTELLFSAFVLYSSSLCLANTEKRPNIIFILADDMGFGDISYLNGGSKIKTYNLDMMADEGAVLMDCHSSSSVSTPTRYGILTGRYNWRSTLKQGVLNGYSKALIPSTRETMASMLKKQGYNTGAIGKWHLGWDWYNIDAGIKNIDYGKPIKNGPTTLGFDYFYGFCGSLDMPPYVYVENDMPTAIPDTITENKGKYSWWRKGPTSSDFRHEEVLSHIIEKGCKYILEKSKSSDPYFLYLPLPAPHTPILPTDEFSGKSGIGEYGDYVLRVDAMVGKILDAAKKSGEDNNTIIVFTADNGCSPAAGISIMEEKGHHSNYIYRGHKADLYDGGHRIPCLVRWPSKISHHKIQQTVCLTDFYATFAAINDYNLLDTEGEDSYNILPALYSVKEVSTIREATVHHSINGEFTIRQGKWKLLLSASSGGWSYPRPGKNDSIIKNLPSMQLYDMESDPSERHNLVNDYPNKVQELKSLLLCYINEGRSTPGISQKNDKGNTWKQVEKIRKLM
ncbi:arylsulfatase [uncultured Bacteroides sp.]|uniref:sulfatase family protein n=1 Tax=uncultured Bacteroides sp. TaxID=162156 RepID=UPI002622B1A6|nr:arylsulfatase [uncultured Bacteroides sp.]